MPGKVWLVRHGRVPANEESRFGWPDETLIPEGINQCVKLQLRLQREKVKFARVYCGTIPRQQQSAHLIAPQYLPILRPELNERHVGLWAGIAHQKIEEKYPEECEAWSHNCFTPPEGEDFADFRPRVGGFMKNELYPAAMAETEAMPILIVSSYLVITAMLGMALNLAPAHWFKFRLENTSISILEPLAEGEWWVYTMGDKAHLLNEEE